MPLFEIETDGHIIITWASDDAEARSMAADAYPNENIKRLTKRPRNSWVISKALLGITNEADTTFAAWLVTAYNDHPVTKSMPSVCTWHRLVPILTEPVLRLKPTC